MGRAGAFLCLLLALGIAASADASRSRPLTPAEGFADLNAWRAELGLPAVTSLHPTLTEGCRLHAGYVSLNGSEGHWESESAPGFTPLGRAAAQSSVLATGIGIPGLADSRSRGPRENWERHVYHRTSLLDPRLRTTWYWETDLHACMGTVRATLPDGTTVEPTAPEPSAGTPSLTAYPSPANGATDVPIATGGETPDPREAMPDPPDVLGWPLSVQFDGPWDTRSLVTSLAQVSLIPDGGPPAKVAGQDSSSRNGSNLDVGVGVFPYGALRRGTWYTARVAGTVMAGQSVFHSTQPFPFDVTWRFKTAGDIRGNWPTFGLRARGSLRGRFLRLRLRTARVALGQRATIAFGSSRNWRRDRLRRRRATLSHRRMRLRYRVGRLKSAFAVIRVSDFRAANGVQYRGRSVVVRAPRR